MEDTVRLGELKKRRLTDAPALKQKGPEELAAPQDPSPSISQEGLSAPLEMPSPSHWAAS